MFSPQTPTTRLASNAANRASPGASKRLAPDTQSFARRSSARNPASRASPRSGASRSSGSSVSGSTVMPASFIPAPLGPGVLARLGRRQPAGEVGVVRADLLHGRPLRLVQVLRRPGDEQP